MTTLITGATGFLGSAVVRLLMAEGREVRALVRGQSDNRNIDGLDIERVTGDLQDGYITPQKAKDVYGFSNDEVREALNR